MNCKITAMRKAQQSRKAAIELAIEAAGGPAKLADAIGRKRPAISRARRLKLIPIEWVLRIEEKYGISRTIQRPDVYPD